MPFLTRKPDQPPFIRALQEPTSPRMKARQCKHNSRNMKRSGDSEGEKRRKVLIAFFSVRSGIFLSPVAQWISNAPYVMLLAALRRLERRQWQRIPHLASFLYCVFHFSPLSLPQWRIAVTLERRFYHVNTLQVRRCSSQSNVLAESHVHDMNCNLHAISKTVKFLTFLLLSY